jgi:hypothetical protein
VTTWPEWAFGVAEGALHFNKKVFVVYNNQPFGNNLHRPSARTLRFDDAR